MERIGNKDTMDNAADPLIWAALCGLLAVDFIVTAFTVSVENLSDSELEDEAFHKDPSPLFSRLESLRDDPARIRCSRWFWQALVCAVSTAIVLIRSESDPDLHTAIAAVLIVLILVYCFGRVLPHMLTHRWRKTFAVRLYKVSVFFMAVCFPFTYVLNFLVSCLAALFGVDSSALDEHVTEDEILSMVNEGHEQGVLDEDEAEMIQNIFEFDEKMAQDIMTHRSRIMAIDGCTRLDDAIRFIVGAPNSRFPVFEGNIDNIVGVLYLKDAMRFHMQETWNDWYVKDIPGLLREVRFIPQTRRIDDLFRDMQKTQVQLAVVVDEYGETSGLVTMEDILEEIVGNIFDEYDRKERLIIALPNERWRLNGLAALDEVSDALGVELEGDYDTLNGYLTARLDHIPGKEDCGTVLEDEKTGFRFRILSLHGSMIQWAEAEKMKENAA